MAFRPRAKQGGSEGASQSGSWGSPPGRSWGHQAVEAEPDRFGSALERKWEEAWRRARAADRPS